MAGAKNHTGKGKRIVFGLLSYLIMTMIAVVFLFPIYCLVVKSIMPDSQLLQSPSLWPDFLNLEPYVKAMAPEYIAYLGNTILVCAASILGVCVSASFCAYGLAKVDFKGKNIAFGLIMATVLLPGTVTSIPLYSIYMNLGWTGTLLPLIIPIWFGGGAMNIFLIRQFIKGIPDSYSEAAILDGASSFTIYYRIVLPLIKPILLYLAVMTFVGQWNDFQGPLMYVSSNPESWTLSLALYQNFADAANATNLPNVQMAVGVIMMIPCVVLYACFQKELTEGVSAVGIKG